MILAVIVSILLGTLLFLSRKESVITQKNSKNLKVCYKAANYIYGNINTYILKKDIKEKIKILKPLSWKTGLQEFYIEKISLVILILMVGTCLMWFAILSRLTSSNLINGKLINRNTYDAGDSTKELQAYSDAWKGAENITITVGEQQYTEEEAESIFDKITKKLDQIILGENDSLDTVYYDLNLVNQVKGYPVTILWKSSDPTLVDTGGKIQKEKLKLEGSLVTLTAELSYYDYQASYTITAKVFPPMMTEKEKLISEIKSNISEIEQSTKEKIQFALPTQVDGNVITWKEKNGKNVLYILILVIISCFAVYMGRDKEIENMVTKREREMLLDYPEIVSKLTIFLGAGMTLFGAWKKIVEDYREKSKRPQFKKRYAYEEMSIAYNEIMSGISEVAAYDRFGMRSGVKRYRKFASLLIQNLKKGSNGLSKMLEVETTEAFEERKRIAKKAGEEAETKILFPMILMLFIVIIIMIVPAFMTFQV